jgi:hypothetical protein
METERQPAKSYGDKHRTACERWVGMPSGLPPEMAIEFMARLNAGSTIGKLTSGKPGYGPAFVNYPRFKKHCQMHPTWGAEARKISEANVIRLKGAPRKALTHCRNGHAFAGDNLYVSPDGKERRCLTCMKFNGKFGRRVSEDQAKRAIEALKAGALLTEICKAGAPSYVVTQRAQFRAYFEDAFARGLTVDQIFDHLAATHRGTEEAKKRFLARRARSENSDFPVNLPVPDLGQPVLNLATWQEQ